MKIFTLFLFTICFSISAWATNFRINGVPYYVTSASNHTVSIGDGNYLTVNTSVSGSLSIPATISYNSITYTVTAIGGRAFLNCSKITSISIPGTVTSIGSDVFDNCTSLTSFNVDSNNPNYSTINGVLFNKNQTSLILYPNAITNPGFAIPGTVTTIEDGAFFNNTYLTFVWIPSSITSIGFGAFSGCSNLTSITIPNSVKSIGNSAFSSCYGLTSITIPPSVISIGDYAFDDCSSLTFITIPSSMTTIGNYVFHFSGLDSITIPNTITSIGIGAFEGCSLLRSITIPGSVTSIGNYAFRESGLSSCTILNTTTYGNCVFGYCGSLTSAIIQDAVTTINDETFSGCSQLTGITIPISVTSIKAAAFASSGLTAITIPRSVTSIAMSAFYECRYLTSIHANNANPSNITLGNTVFIYTPTSTCTLYVPTGSKSLYAVAPQWSEFTNIVEERVRTGIALQQTDNLTIRVSSGVVTLQNVQVGVPVQLFDISGKLLYSSTAIFETLEITLPAKGIYIVKIGNTTKKVVCQ